MVIHYDDDFYLFFKGDDVHEIRMDADTLHDIQQAVDQGRVSKPSV